jgi:hypothetical protein
MNSRINTDSIQHPPNTKIIPESDCDKPYANTKIIPESDCHMGPYDNGAYNGLPIRLDHSIQ